MGKYNLGEVSTVVSDKIQKKGLYVNEKKADDLVYDIDLQLNAIKKSLTKIQSLINQSVNMGVVSGKRATAFKSWARKAKSQANQSEKLRVSLVESYRDDVKAYPIYLLDERIASLEAKIVELSNKMWGEIHGKEN